MDYTELFTSKMDELIMDAMQKNNTAGTSIGIVEDGKFHMARCYGSKNFEANTPTDEHTLFCVASVTKFFICAGILKLQEQGKLKVTDPISKYLPISVSFEDDPITIHHLMSHQSGIPDLADYMWARNREEQIGIGEEIPKYPFSSWDDGFRYLNGAQEYLSRPGERFHYNNFAFGILSKLITEVAGKSYKAYLREHIFDPLEMKRTGFYDEVREDENLSRAYITKPGSKVRTLQYVHYDDIKLTRSLDEAAGGLFSNVVELANYMIMLLSGGRFGDLQVLSEESVTQMQEHQFVEQYPSAAFKANYAQEDSGYGYGFAIDKNFHGNKLVQHSGSFSGASAWFSFLPGLNRGVIILSNHHPSPRQYAQAILLETLGKNCETDWPVLKLMKHHNKLSGQYHAYKELVKIKVSSDGSQLLITLPGGHTITPIPLDSPFGMDYYLPSAAGGKDPLQFYTNEQGTWLHYERMKLRKVKEL